MNLFDICRKENLTYEELKEGIDKFSSEINSTNGYQETALMLLCNHNPKLNFIKLMVKSRGNVRIRDINDCLAYLFLSNKDFDIDVVEYLMELGCDIGKMDFNGNNILHEIIRNNAFSIKKLEILMKLKPNMINVINKDNASPLMYLCEYYPKLEFINLFIKYGANPIYSLVYLFSSEKDFDIDVVEYLISQGCDIGEKIGYNKNTILHVLVISCSFSVKKLEMLLKLKPDMINEVNNDNVSPLMYLCEHYPWLELIKLLIKYGADPKHSLMYLFLSQRNFGFDVIVEYLISQGGDIGNRDSLGNNILHKIIQKRVLTTKKLEILMKLKPDMINEINTLSVTPLMYLCKYYPELDLVKQFVEYGADVNSVDNENKNCLFYLFNSHRNSDINVAEYLVSQGCKFTESTNGSNVLSLFAFGINFKTLDFKTLDFLAGHNQKLGNNVNVKVREYFNFKNKLSFSSNQLFY